MKTTKQNKTVLVFGTFDRLHEGHRDFLRQAKALGSRLVVSLAQDHIVEDLKGKRPSQNLSQRQEALEQVDEVDELVEGDEELGKYANLAKIDPDVIALGYDQDALKKNLKRWLKTQNLSPEIITLKAHKPEIYKTSLLS